MDKTDEKPEVKEREIGERVVLHANFEPTKTKDLGNGVIEAVITSGATDHHNENILMDGVDTNDYHGTVLYGHDYEGLPIGKTLSLTKMKSKIKAKFQLAVDVYPFANLIYEMIKGGFLTDVSIGGLVRKWSDDWMTIEEMVMKEFSVVPIGANPEAMITSFKALKLDPKAVKQEYQDFVRGNLLDKLADMPDDELKDAVRILKGLTARLEETVEASLTDDKNTKHVKRYTVLNDAKSVATQAQKVITTIKLKA